MTKGKEVSLWADLTPEMMSDEEVDGDVYVRHQPSYHSELVNKFILKLDTHLARGDKGNHPRKKRRLGSPRNKPIPRCAKQWTVKKETNANPESPEIASTDQGNPESPKSRSPGSPSSTDTEDGSDTDQEKGDSDSSLFEICSVYL